MRVLAVILMLGLPALLPAQLLAPGREAYLKQHTPRVEGYKLFDTSDGSRWVMYEDGVFPEAFQRPSGNATSFHAITEGQRSGDEFPWIFTGGTHKSGSVTWYAIRLPKGGRFRYRQTWVFNDLTNRGYAHDLTAPTDTQLWEFVAHPKSTEVYEVRMAEKVGSAGGSRDWERHRFFPFKDARDWAVSTGGRVLGMREETIADPLHPTKKAFENKRFLDVIDNAGRALVKDRVFVETNWAPTTDMGGAIVPKGYLGGLVTGRCQTCHAQVGEHAARFDAALLGSTWLVRGTPGLAAFSINPADPSCVSKDGRVLRFVPHQGLVRAGLLEAK